LEAGEPPFFRPAPDSVEHRYMMERRAALGGSLPQRVVRSKPLPAPAAKTFAEFAEGSSGRAVSTTMAFAVMLRNILRDAGFGSRVVPIIPDEARTFGLDALFKEVKIYVKEVKIYVKEVKIYVKEVKIYAPSGQLYEPVDSKLMLSYDEASDGRGRWRRPLAPRAPGGPRPAAA